MAVDNEGLGAEPVLDTSHMQELDMLRILLQQMNNLNPEPETQDTPRAVPRGHVESR